MDCESNVVDNIAVTFNDSIKFSDDDQMHEYSQFLSYPG